MGWFDEQIQERKAFDDEQFSQSLEGIAGAILGDKLSKIMSNDRIVTQTALDEVFKYLYLKPVTLPDHLPDVDAQLDFVTRPYGLMYRMVSLDKNWFQEATGAMLGSIDGKLVALIPSGLSGYRYLQQGKWVKVTKQNQSQFDGNALVFYQSFPLRELKLVDLIKFSVSTFHVADFLLILASTFLVAVVGMLVPKLALLLYGDVLEGGNVQVLVGIFILYISVTLSSSLFGVISGLFTSRLNAKMGLAVNAATMMRILTLPTDFFKKYSAGELSSRVGMVAGVCDTLISVFMNTGLTSIFSLIYVAQIYQYAPSLVMPALSVTASTVALTIVTAFGQMKISKKTMELSSKEQGMTYSLLTGITKIKLSGAEKRAFSKWANLYAQSAKLQYNPPLFFKINSVFSVAITLIGNLVMYYFAVESGVTVTEYYAFTAAYGMVSASFFAFAGITTIFSTIKPSLDMVKPILEEKPELSSQKEYLSSVSGGIELSNVSFRYTEDMPLVLDNLSLKIKSGQYVAIVGKTGCGKSTLLRLLLGFELPQKGSVYYDGKDLKNIDTKSLRQKIGVVMQNAKLFQGDIFSNIVISAPRLTLAEAWEAAELAGIKKDIEEMPMGMHTVLSEGQGGISGGQKQRLMIARAVAPKPKILFFDEATSALDNVTQKQVADSLDGLKCTRVVIAHRLSTIRHCDRIIVLDKGKILEDGTYDQLLENKGYFSELVARQLLGDNENSEK